VRCPPGVLLPPDPDLHKTGHDPSGDRGENELRLLEHFGLQPSADILDIGCGIGRLAYECASYLDDDATYTGFDIEPRVIEWLNANYAPHLAGFRFDLIDVFNDRYRPDGALEPERLRFPYADEQFDVACAFEVFMHVSLDGVRNYLSEITRVLRPGGLAVVTLVVIYPGEEAGFVRSGREYVNIADGVYTRFPQRRSMAMAYDVDLFRSVLDESGLVETGQIKGLNHIPWPKRPGAVTGLPVPALSHGCDLFAARKRSPDWDSREVRPDFTRVS
jgi:SAM-dependent methyltransferase